LQTAEAALPPDHWQLAEFRKRFAQAAVGVGRAADARAQLETAHAAMLRAHGGEHRRTVGVVKAMIDFAIAVRDPGLAASWRTRLPEAQRDYALEAERALRAAGR
jgi:hypothetical protein